MLRLPLVLATKTVPSVTSTVAIDSAKAALGSIKEHRHSSAKYRANRLARIIGIVSGSSDQKFFHKKMK